MPRGCRSWIIPRRGVLVSAPCLFLILSIDAWWLPHSLSIWYPRHMLQFRIGLFFGAASLAGAFSGLLAYGIGFMSGTHGMLGWSWIFVRILPSVKIRAERGARFLKALQPFVLV